MMVADRILRAASHTAGAALALLLTIAPVGARAATPDASPAGEGPVIGPAETIVSEAPFQQYVTKTCGGTATCFLNFATVPASARLEITNASCYYTGTGVPDYIQLLVHTAAQALVSKSTLAQTNENSNGSAVVASANDAVFVFASAGQHFQIFTGALTGVVSFIACHISGHLLKLQ